MIKLYDVVRIKDTGITGIVVNIATNLLHMTTESGTDELMIVRVLIAQLLSFALVTGFWTKWKKTHSQSA